VSRGVLIGGALAALALIAGAAFLFMGAAESQEEKDYKEKLAKAMGPVLGANEQLSEEVDDVEGSDVSDAKSAVKKLKREITRADGAIGSLEVPADLEQLRRDARNVLSREERYVAAIEEVLANPASSKVDDLEDREADLIDALDNAGPTIAGEDEVVFGIENLEDWAPKLVKARAKIAAAKKAKAAAAKKKREEAEAAAQSSGTSVAPSSTRWAVPAANGKDCGGGLYAGANTTCAFSEVVRSAYNFAPTTVANVDAYSPVTQRTYSMYCRPSGDWILCTGGNNASVWF
jgi:peptidoglycan hydrolase CwlO-like protein